MVANLHEDYGRQHAVKTSSDRSFGFVFTAFSALVAAREAWVYNRHAYWWAAAALITLGITSLRPSLLAPFNKAWTKLGLLLFKVISPLTLGLIFITAVVPVGILMRLTGKDPLRLNRNTRTSSYWIERTPPGPAPETMINQF